MLHRNNALVTQTLIHNDFHPRNIAFRNIGATSSTLGLCVFDWELATIGPPEHDIAELLCFSLPEGASRSDVVDLLDLHRTSLEGFVERSISYELSMRAFAASLRYLFVNRLAMYALYSGIMPDEQYSETMIVPVFKRWRRLFSWFGEDSGF